MAYRLEKGTNDIVIDGFEKGVASSPHFGIANLQNANISTELGEVTAAFAREKQTLQGTISGGTLTFDSTGGNTTLLDAPSTLYGGQWITVTAATATTLASSVDFDYLVVAGGGAGGASLSATTAGGGGGAGGLLTGTKTITATGAYTVTIGAGGTGGAGTGATGSDSVLSTIATAKGGGGGGNGGTAATGITGGSGGGGGANGGAAGSGGTGTASQGNDGGTAASGAKGGGGGGSGGVGQPGGGTHAGGVGTSSSINGTPTTYSTGGDGANEATTGAGTVGAANTGNGGGGSGQVAGNHNGANGGSGVVIIRYLTADLTATGGTITTDGSHTVHTFTSGGTFTVTALTKLITLPTGNYYISYKDGVPQVKISENYDPFCDHPVTFVTSGTITFNLTIVLGNPISKATERFGDATQNQYRYYILDEDGYVWVHDTAVYDFTLVDSGIGVNWILPDPTTYAAPANSIAILNGWLIWLNTIQIFGKPTCNLGEQFELLDNAYMNNKFPTHTNYALMGHQGRMYWCDGNYIGSMFPDTSIITGANNVQSYAQYTASSTTGTMTKLFSGAFPYTVDSSGSEIRIPVVFFTDQYGTQPTDLTVETVYYIGGATPATGQFSVYAAASGGSAIDIATGASGNQYFNTFYPVGSHSGIYGDATTVTFSSQRLNLPTYEVAQTLAEIGNQVLVGCIGNVVYPWNQVDVTPAGLINLPESNVQYILTVNQTAYMFAGNQGNIYITDGSLASLALNLADYLAGVPGSPGTYIESTYAWKDSMYLRGRVYFGVLDQSASKAGNCGGIWSFVPTQNIYIEQDIGTALRLESQNSYGTYNGADALLIPNAVQNAQQPLYWSAWYSSVSTPTYGIDYSTGGTNASFPTIIETDWIPVGTMLNKRTTNQLEYKLGAPLDTGATITAKYRAQLTDTWTACDTFITDSTKLAGYARANYQQLQWIQFQFTLTPITSSASTNTFIRFREIRLR